MNTCPQSARNLKLRKNLMHVSETIGEGVEEEPTPDVEECTSEDVDEIVQLVRAVWTMGVDSQREKIYGRTLGMPWQDHIETSVREYLKRPNVQALQIREEGRLAGFTSYRVDAFTGLGEIGYNAVNPDFRGKGLGKVLLNAALICLRKAGRNEVEVVTGMDPGHAPARAVYEGAGFKPFIRTVRYTLNLEQEIEGGSEPHG